MAPTFKRITSVALDSLTWLIAAIGLISVLAYLASLFFGVSIVLFATDSMSPTIPQGSAALAIQTPASEIRVGDIVTINRDAQDEMPITHRVVEVSEAPGDAAARELVLKGDNNLSVDAAGYQVDEVRRVFFSVPGFAPVFMLLSDLRILIALGIVVIGLLIRAFWRPKAQTVQPDPELSPRRAARARAELVGS